MLVSCGIVDRINAAIFGFVCFIACLSKNVCIPLPVAVALAVLILDLFDIVAVFAASMSIVLKNVKNSIGLTNTFFIAKERGR